MQTSKRPHTLSRSLQRAHACIKITPSLLEAICPWGWRCHIISVLMETWCIKTLLKCASIAHKGVWELIVAVLRFVILINTVGQSGWGENMCCVALRDEKFLWKERVFKQQGWESSRKNLIETSGLGMTCSKPVLPQKTKTKQHAPRLWPP